MKCGETYPGDCWKIYSLHRTCELEEGHEGEHRGKFMSALGTPYVLIWSDRREPVEEEISE